MNLPTHCTKNTIENQHVTKRLHDARFDCTIPTRGTVLKLILILSCFRTLDFQWNFNTPGGLVTTSLLKLLGPS